MRNIVSVAHIVISLAGAALVSAPAWAAEPQGGTAPPAPSATPKGYECHDQALSGSGPGFKSSQEESAEAAIADWLTKAKEIYADADWKFAKDPSMECVKQGLYSKCFAIGIPCHPKPGTAE
jgi:hypothetical protein